MVRVIRMITRWLTVLTTACASAASGQTSPFVISQIYGGGGNSGAPLQADFIELFNRGSQAVDLTGWTVQYASASGVTWERTALSGSVQPGQYYLVQENQGSVGTSLSTPDAMGGINLSASAGKVAVVATNGLLSESAPTGPQIIDFVGYGNANAAEGSPAPWVTENFLPRNGR